MIKLLDPPYPSGNRYPILTRLELDAHGIEVHVDNYITDAKDAIYVIRNMLTALIEAETQINNLKDTLEKIAKWQLPASGVFYSDGREMSYMTAYGSYGERSYIQNLAETALAAVKETKHND